MGAYILPGVTIGDNAIIGAGAIVTKDICSNSCYAGVPAKYICSIEEYYKRSLEKVVDLNGLSDVDRKNTLIKKFM